VPIVDSDICVRCGGCVSGYDGTKGCPQEAIKLAPEGIVIDRDKCVECGQCRDYCALGAIE